MDSVSLEKPDEHGRKVLLGGASPQGAIQTWPVRIPVGYPGLWALAPSLRIASRCLQTQARSVPEGRTEAAPAGCGWRPGRPLSKPSFPLSWPPQTTSSLGAMPRHPCFSFLIHVLHPMDEVRRGFCGFQGNRGLAVRARLGWVAFSSSWWAPKGQPLSARKFEVLTASF